MTLEEIYYVSQIAAAVAIFGSLVFVGLQMRQTSRNQRALMHANRNQDIQQSLHRMGGPAMARVLLAGAAATPSMDSLDVNQFIFAARATFSGMQHQFLEWREGMIDDVRWKITRDSLNILLTSPGYRAAYLMWRAYGATPPFRAVCDDMIQKNECQLPADTSAIWRTLAAQQLEGIRLKTSEQKALPQEAEV